MSTKCIEITDPRVIKLSEESGLPKIVVAAKVSLWQEKWSAETNSDVTRFPTDEELYNNDFNYAELKSIQAQQYIESKSKNNQEEEVVPYDDDDVIAEDIEFSAQEGLELNPTIEQERKALKRILPKSIAVELNDSFLTVLDNGRIAVGYFKSGMIYLN